MKTVPGQILLEIKQQTNSFLVKQNSNGSSKVQFSEYINNLCNSHWFKFAGRVANIYYRVTNVNRSVLSLG